MTNFRKQLFTIFVLAFIPFLITSCSDDNDEPQSVIIPANAIRLNMMNESHGKSLLGNTDVYLSDNRNFISPADAFIGVVNELPSDLNCPPSLSQLFTQMAVTPGKIYQIFPRENIHRFPSGNNAIKNGSPYLNVCIESWIKNGAKVAFLENIAHYDMEIGADTYRNSAVKSDEVRENSVSYPAWPQEVEIISITSDNKNIIVTPIQPSRIEITTTGPVTADILVYIYNNGYYTAQTIHITPSDKKPPIIATPV